MESIVIFALGAMVVLLFAQVLSWILRFVMRLMKSTLTLIVFFLILLSLYMIYFHFNY